MATFEVSSSFVVPVERLNGSARFIDTLELKAICKGGAPFGEWLQRNGIYIFSIRAGKGSKPWYVGKSEEMNFFREAFNPRNQNALNRLISGRRGTLEVTFVSQVRSKGKPNKTQIAEIEYLLIGMAYERNGDLLNIKNKVQKDDFVIKNVYNSGAGKRSAAEREFRDLLGF